MHNKRSHNRPLRGLDLNRCASFGLCCGRWATYEIASEMIHEAH